MKTKNWDWIQSRWKPLSIYASYLITFLVILLLPVGSECRKKVDVYVAGFFPVGEGPKKSLGRGVMPALNLAVKHVNDHPTILRNYKLHVEWNDTKCNTAIGTKAFFDMMYKPPRKVMLFGGACTLVTDPLAKAARHWRITQLSYADTHPMFTSKQYPHFFRMAPSEKEFNMPRLHLLERFNWTRVGTLYQNEPRHVLTHNHMLSLLNAEDIYDIAESQSFADEFKDQLTKIREKDVRIILGYFDEIWARKIFCDAYRKKMYGKYYQWIITGMYRKQWWSLKGTDDDETPNVGKNYTINDENPCLVEEIMTALEGCIMLDLLPLASTDVKTVSGKNISHYEHLYRSKKGKEYSRFHGYTYDGVWAMALAIQSVGHSLHKKNYLHKTNTSVQDFVYRDVMWEVLFKKAISEVRFEGVTGPVQFTKDNIRKGYILLKQFQDGREVKIGEFDGFKNELRLDRGDDIYWPGGDPPLDRTFRVVEKTRVNFKIYLVFVVLSSLGIVMGSIFLAINIKFRNQRYIKMSSPHLNNFIIIGCIMCYASIILLGLDSELTSESNFHIVCSARGWALMSGFTLAFGSMFSKTWRVHSIFTDVQINKRVIKDFQLFIIVFGLLFIDIVIMITWQIIDPFRRETKLMKSYMRGDVKVIPENEYCMGNHMSIFLGCIYAEKGLLLIFGCFLAWETRLVSIPALNDSKYIGMSVYNVVIMCVLGVPISYILNDDQDAMYLIISIFIFFCTTGTLCLVFVPKIIELRRNPQGTIDKRMVRGTLKPPKRNDSDSEISDLHDHIKKAETDRRIFERKLKNTDDEVKLLINELGDESLDDMVEHRAMKPIIPRKISVEHLGIISDYGRLSVTETTEVTELTSVCSGISQDEYVGSRCVSSPITSFSNTNTTSVYHFHNSRIEHQLPRGQSPAFVRDPIASSPDHATREVPKSVSFKLERIPAMIPTNIPANIESVSSVVISPSAVPQLSPSPNYRGHLPPPSTRVIANSGAPPPAYSASVIPANSPQNVNILEHENIAYGGYGGVYVHDYGGQLSQKEQKTDPDRRGSRCQLPDPMRPIRTNVSVLPNTTYPWDMPVYPSTQRMCTGPQNAMEGISGEIMLRASNEGRPIMPQVPSNPAWMYESYCHRPGAGPTSDKYVQSQQNVYAPLNNHPPIEKIQPFSLRKPELTIINNTATFSQKHSNMTDSSTKHSYSVDIPGEMPLIMRRSSETPNIRNRKHGNPRKNSMEITLRSASVIDPLIKGGSADYEEVRREEEREFTRTISRAHLRRDSFGEVSSRRSPSQESPEVLRNKIFPAVDGNIENVSNIVSAVNEGWTTSALSHHYPSQDSLHSQGETFEDRIVSQESLGTMSSRGSFTGSLYSYPSRTEAYGGRRHHKKKIPEKPELPLFLNGELVEAAASTDDLSHKNGKETFREPAGLHRTSSEPYYNFQGIDVPDDLQGYQKRGIGHRVLPVDAFDPGIRTLGRPRGPSSYTERDSTDYSRTLRGTSFSSRRARITTSSVAAALAKAKNASDNALDHNISILPIFQKLLSERQSSFSRDQEYKMSSCPNITIKCDIVEYL